MRPQELMDLPYAGMAEKELRKFRLWRLMPHEKIEKALDNLAGYLDGAQDLLSDIEREMENNK